LTFNQDVFILAAVRFPLHDFKLENTLVSHSNVAMCTKCLGLVKKSAHGQNSHLHQEFFKVTAPLVFGGIMIMPPCPFGIPAELISELKLSS
jgi:hypothetical protein